MTPHAAGYRPDIDGLRAVAVLAVIAFHAYPGLLPGGFIGVDVFFVISGFLITGVILGDLERGTFTFADFYARRIRRIFPALLVVLVAAWIAGWFLLLADEYKSLGRNIAAGALFLSNVSLWTEAGYFDAAAELKPLLHLWSLGIEEQFYIAWPLVMVIAWRLRGSLVTVAGVIGLVSFVLCVLSADGDPTTAFYLPHTRVWELLVGATLAVAHSPTETVARRFHGAHSIVGLQRSQSRRPYSVPPRPSQVGGRSCRPWELGSSSRADHSLPSTGTFYRAE